MLTHPARLVPPGRDTTLDVRAGGAHRDIRRAAQAKKSSAPAGSPSVEEHAATSGAQDALARYPRRPGPGLRESASTNPAPTQEKRRMGRPGIEPGTLGLRGPSQGPDALRLALHDLAKRLSTRDLAADSLPRALPRLDLLPNCYSKRVGFGQPTKKPSRDCHRRGHGHTGGPACQHQILPPQSSSASSAATPSTKPSGATGAGS